MRSNCPGVDLCCGRCGARRDDYLLVSNLLKFTHRAVSVFNGVAHYYKTGARNITGQHAETPGIPDFGTLCGDLVSNTLITASV